MAVHRTKEQKKRAEERRQEVGEQVSFQYAGGQTLVQKKSKKIQPTVEDERTAFLKKDLLHSLVVSAIMMLCFVGIYSYLRYNDTGLVSVLF